MDVHDFNPIVTPSDKWALDHGYTFDPVKADRPVQFIERYCKLSTGDFAGKPLILLDWMKQVLWRTHGWMDPDGNRRHREVFVEIPKKNAKSTLVSAWVLYLALADGEARPKIHCNATDKEQASLIWEEADQMIMASKDLKKRFVSSKFHKSIICPKTGGIIKTNSSDIDSKDGGNVSTVVFDELHRFTGNRREAWNVYAGSGAARRQPLKISISTAGYDRFSVMFEQHNRALKIESGDSLEDVGFCGVVYGPRDGEKYDPHDEETWHRFNPSLGTTMSLAGFRADYESQRHSPESFNYWLRTRLNVWTQAATRFIDSNHWAACPPRRKQIPPDAVWYAGLDLSSTRDITAFVRITGDLTEGIDVYLHAWIPEEEAERRLKTNGVQYRQWAKDGFITITPGSRIDYTAVQEAITAEFIKTPFVSLLGDFYNANLVGNNLIASGLPFKTLQQGFLSQNSPTKEFERLVATGKLRHGNNPVLTWAAANCVAIRDKADNVQLDKSKSTDKIDPAQALVNAIAGMIHATQADATPPTITDGTFIWR